MENNGKFIHPVTHTHHPQYLTGVIAPMFTPAHEDGTIDYDGYRAYTRWLVEDPGITALFVRCGVGRMFSYTVDDVKRSLDTVLEAAQAEKPVLCGTSGESHQDRSQKVDPSRYLDQTLELSHYAKQHGARAAVLVIPSCLPVEPGLNPEETSAAFYEKVHQETDIPLLMYNPQMTPAEFHSTPSLIQRLAKLPRMTALVLVKDGTD